MSILLFYYGPSGVVTPITMPNNAALVRWRDKRAKVKFRDKRAKAKAK